MNHRSWLALITAPAAVLLTAATAAAPIYKTTDEQGNVVYTDDPGERPAVEVDLPDLTIVSPTELPGPGAGSAEPAVEEDPEPAVALELLRPEHEETIRSNTGDVEVVARIDRALRDGDRFEVLVDGEVRGRNAGGAFALTGIDRGAHEVRVRLVNGSGTPVATTDTHTFFLHQASRLNP